MADASGRARKSRSVSRPSPTVRSVERCIDILDTLAQAQSPMTLSSISRAIGTPKSTTLTIVRTLVHRGIINVDSATKLYGLGLGFGRYAAQAPRSVDLVALATPVLQKLAHETLETATLAMHEGDKVYNVCRIVGPQPLQLVVPIGIPRELHATAGGKVFLAWMSEAERRKFLATHPLPRFTPRTITDPAALARRLVAARRQGYAVARGETSPGLFGVAAPIFCRGGSVIAAANLSGPLFRLQPNQQRYVEAVVDAAATISREIERVGGELELPHPGAME